MISQEILESIECVVPHKCSKKLDASKSCIFCEIDYHFIAKEPVLLECQHNVCKDCKGNAQNEKCKLCNEFIKLTHMGVKSTEILIQLNLKELFEILKIKFNEATKMFQCKKFDSIPK